METFETKKNIKAGTITGIICGAMLFLFFIISWTSPLHEIPVQEEGIEVNLGNSDIGSGDIQPLNPESPAAVEEEVNTPPKTQHAETQEIKDVETNDNDKEAPNISLPKPVKPVTEKQRLPEENTSPSKLQTQTAVVEILHLLCQSLNIFTKVDGSGRVEIMQMDGISQDKADWR
jgi:hypothetical protein